MPTIATMPAPAPSFPPRAAPHAWPPAEQHRCRPAIAVTVAVTVVVAAVIAADVRAPSTARGQAPAAPTAAPALVWYDITEWGVEGRGWEDEARARFFDRLPAAAQADVTPVIWNLSRDSTGILSRFQTDAAAIHVRLRLRSGHLAKPHMPASGASGVDLYARDDAGSWRWVAATKPESQEIELPLIAGLAAGAREYAVYLPLFNGVESLEIGVPADASFMGLEPRSRPIVFYGTSITHGACASRPGMTHVAILGRRLDRPVLNLGFSGNGTMDAAVGDLLGRLDAACFVIDCLPNMNAAAVRQRCVPLVRSLRAARPTTPIVLVEDRRFTNAWITPAKQAFHDDNHAALREAFASLEREGIDNLWYVSGDSLLGDDGDGAVDASHPNDLGFARQADAFEPILRAALAAPAR